MPARAVKDHVQPAPDQQRCSHEGCNPTGEQVWPEQRHALQGCRQNKEHLPQPVWQHAKKAMGVDIAQKLGLWHGQAVKADTEQKQHRPELGKPVLMLT